MDTLGLLLAVVVHRADIQDRDGLWLLLARLQGRFVRLAKLFADAGYQGRMEAVVSEVFGWVLEIVKRWAEARGFVVLPKRWIVERTLAWLGRNRRLSKDYEERTESSEAMVQIAMIHLMLRRLRPA